MAGSVTNAAVGTSLSVLCSDYKGTAVECDKTDAPILAKPDGSNFAPLIVGDYRNSVFLRPTTLGSLAGSPAAQTLDFAEKANGAFAPDFKAPFGFATGAVLHRARVVHWYLRANAAGYSELVRSQPVLRSTALGAACSTADSDAPFLDETNGGTVKGVAIGSGPITSLQIRYVVDLGHADDPQGFTVWRSADAAPTTNQLTPCDTSVMGVGGSTGSVLREVRLQVVARSVSTDKTSSGSTVSAVNAGNQTPGFEGSAGGTVKDVYARRTFTSRVVPRNLQIEGSRL
jgi:hypothetical protein